MRQKVVSIVQKAKIKRSKDKIKRKSSDYGKKVKFGDKMSKLRDERSNYA